MKKNIKSLKAKYKAMQTIANLARAILARIRVVSDALNPDNADVGEIDEEDEEFGFEMVRELERLATAVHQAVAANSVERLLSVLGSVSSDMKVYLESWASVPGGINDYNNAVKKLIAMRTIQPDKSNSMWNATLRSPSASTLKMIARSILKSQRWRDVRMMADHVDEIGGPQDLINLLRTANPTDSRVMQAVRMIANS